VIKARGVALKVLNDVARKKFIRFALNDDAKRWMYGLKVNSIGCWDCFVHMFVRRYFPTHKTIKLRDEILSFMQLEHKSF